MSSIINRTKGSSHPTPPGGIYVGIIKTVAQDGRVYVTIPKLGNTIGPMRVTNLNLNNKPTIGTQVLCAYTNMSNDEMYVIGNITPTSEAASGSQYALGDTGPAGGIVFYNKGKVSNGWQYLEMAPPTWDPNYAINGNTEQQFQWINGYYANIANARHSTIGSGVDNSEAIKIYADSQGTTYPATNACLNLTFGGLSDWFLPSFKEMETAISSGVIEFAFAPGGTGYWTSTQAQANVQALYVDNFGNYGSSFKGGSYCVRPVRRF